MSRPHPMNGIHLEAGFGTGPKSRDWRPHETRRGHGRGADGHVRAEAETGDVSAQERGPRTAGSRQRPREGHGADPPSEPPEGLTLPTPRCGTSGLQNRGRIYISGVLSPRMGGDLLRRPQETHTDSNPQFPGRLTVLEHLSPGSESPERVRGRRPRGQLFLAEMRRQAKSKTWAPAFRGALSRSPSKIRLALRENVCDKHCGFPTATPRGKEAGK